MTNPIQSVGALGARTGIDRAQGGFGSATEATPAGGASFKDTLTNALGGVQDLQDGAASAVDAFLKGEPVELHDVMAAVEEAGIALEMLIQVRDRLVETYRTVVNMQT